MNQLSVLIADDERIVRDGLTQHVDWDSYDMDVSATAENGQIAYDYIENNRVDLLITDIHMPVLDGMRLLERLDGLPGAPLVILISGFSDFSYAQAAVRSGIVQDYILKPLDLDRIHVTLGKVRDKILRDNSSVQFPVLDETEWELYTSYHASAIRTIQSEIIEHLELGEVDEAVDRFDIAIDACRSHDLSYCFISRFCIELCLNVSELALRSFGLITLLRNDPVKDIAVLRHETEIVEYVKKTISRAGETVRNPSKSHLSPVIQRVLIDINANYSDFTLSLNGIAEANRLTASYLSNRFKVEVGVNYIKYLNGLRIRKAKEHLHNPTLKVFMVSKKVGYEDVRYFSRIFRKHTGYTPTEYQKAVTHFSSSTDF